jgi:hypothetical protein
VYGLSWIFLGVAIGTLAYGLTQPGLTFIYVSIGASVVALLFLGAGILRKKPVQPATAGAPYGPTPEEAAAPTAETTAVTTRPPAPARPTASVVAIPERGTYHQSDCRFVKGRSDTERLTKATAESRGYSACDVCKPA